MTGAEATARPRLAPRRTSHLTSGLTSRLQSRRTSRLARCGAGLAVVAVLAGCSGTARPAAVAAAGSAGGRPAASAPAPDPSQTPPTPATPPSPPTPATPPGGSSASPGPVRPDPMAAPAARMLAAGARSVSVAVYRHGTLTARTYGPGVDPTTRYRIASISKTVTDLAALRLAAQGRLDLHAPLAPMLRAMGFTVSPAFARLSVDALQTHTAGFGTMVDYPGMSCRAEVQRILAAAPSPPIGTYSYSNHDHCLLGLVLAQVTGADYATVAQRLVWSPAGVTDARFATDSTTLVAGDAPTDLAGGRGNYLGDLGAAAAWLASPSDLVAVVRSMTPAEQAALRATPNGSYGHGIMYAGPAWGHVGSIWGAAACLWVEPDGTVWAVTAATPGTSVHGGDLRDRFLAAVQSM